MLCITLRIFFSQKRHLCKIGFVNIRLISLRWVTIDDTMTLRGDIVTLRGAGLSHVLTSVTLLSSLKPAVYLLVVTPMLLVCYFSQGIPQG